MKPITSSTTQHVHVTGDSSFNYYTMGIKSTSSLDSSPNRNSGRDLRSAVEVASAIFDTLELDQYFEILVYIAIGLVFVSGLIGCISCRVAGPRATRRGCLCCISQAVHAWRVHNDYRRCLLELFCVAVWEGTQGCHQCHQYEEIELNQICVGPAPLSNSGQLAVVDENAPQPAVLRLQGGAADSQSSSQSIQPSPPSMEVDTDSSASEEDVHVIQPQVHVLDAEDIAALDDLELQLPPVELMEHDQLDVLNEPAPIVLPGQNDDPAAAIDEAVGTSEEDAVLFNSDEARELTQQLEPNEFSPESATSDLVALDLSPPSYGDDDAALPGPSHAATGVPPGDLDPLSDIVGPEFVPARLHIMRVSSSPQKFRSLTICPLKK